MRMVPDSLDRAQSPGWVAGVDPLVEPRCIILEAHLHLDHAAGAASPFHVPNHRAVRSGSVTLAHTSWMGARKVRLTTSSSPSGSRRTGRWVGWSCGVLLSLIPRVERAVLAAGAVDLGLECVEATLQGRPG